ncbi:hypothetical protein LguiB_007728 [Lonicera macranthoides]
MERRFNRDLSGERKGLRLQMKGAEPRRSTASRAEKVPDLTDFMNDMFFGTVKTEKKVYNLGGDLMDNDDDDSFDASTRSNNSKLTQEWLEEAKRMVASSPSRGSESPSRLVGSNRFAMAQPRLSSASNLDRRDPFSRSARRQRAGEGVGGEILSKSAKHTHSRTNSESFSDQPLSPVDISPASAVQKWFSSILKPPTLTPPPPPAPASSPTPTPPISIPNPSSPTLPPRQSTHRKSRFQNNNPNPNSPQPPGIPAPPSKRTFKTSAPASLLSPPKHLVESTHRRSISSSTCSLPEDKVLSPPRNLVESAHRRSISSATCSTDRLQNPSNVNVNGQLKDGELGGRELNFFLREKRLQIGKILSGENDGKAKFVLSGPSNSTSSMVAAICYAWLLENRRRNNRDGGGQSEVVILPVMNVRRREMWKQRQAAWLFHHAGVDASTLVFSDEMDLETLMMAKQLNILVVGQDILKTNAEVGSQCTILTDNFCEDSYDLLQTSILKILLLAGILLDTQNLNLSAKLSMTRDAEAVQLLSVGSAPNYGNALYDQLMQDQRDNSFFEALRHNFGKPPDEGKLDSRAPVEHTPEKKSYPEAVVQNSGENFNHVKNARANAVTSKTAKQKPLPAQAPAADASRGKNKFSIAKFFGFGK